MANVNKVILIGNLTRDPQVKFLSNQMAVCDFGLATNRRWTSQDGQTKEETTFVDCSAFGKQAELLGKYMKKGQPLFVEGRLKLDQWEQPDGAKRSKLKVVIENFQFLGTRGDGGGNAGSEVGDTGEYAARQPRAPRPMNRAPQAPVSTPNYDDDIAPPAPHESEAPPISEDDIPF